MVRPCDRICMVVYDKIKAMFWIAFSLFQYLFTWILPYLLAKVLFIDTRYMFMYPMFKCVLI